MIRALATIVLLNAIISSIAASNCDDYIASLAAHDMHLNGRKELAMNLITNGTTAQKFVQSLENGAKAGDKYSCGFTRFWIDGIFVGPARQYEELRRSVHGIGYGPEAGYFDLVGDKRISKLFYAYADLAAHFVLYKFQIAGLADHVWAVLQMPGPKYKVYQSYNMAYSLHAWLSKDITGMYNKNPPGHIRYWDDVYNNFRVFLSNMGGQINVNGSIIFPSTISEPMKKWAHYVVDYNQVNIETNFKTAWNKFGQNKWIEADVFNRDYVDVLQHVVDTMKTLNGTTNPWTDDLNNKWISLFASPNPVCFPGVPFNTLTYQLEQKLELQTRVEVVTMENNTCYKNFLSMAKTVPMWKSAASKLTSMSMAIMTPISFMFAKNISKI